MAKLENILFRSACSEDAAVLVPMIEESSGGVWPVMWKTLSNKTRSYNDIAADYLIDPSNQLSIANTLIAEHNGTIVGAVITYKENRTSASSGRNHFSANFPEELKNALQPYRELTVTDSLFIAELCTASEFRGLGVGKRMLVEVQKKALQNNYPTITLRVFSENLAAIRLYKYVGFKCIDRRAAISYPGIAVSGDVLLMQYVVDRSE